MQEHHVITKHSPLGVIDSGVGGLTTVAALSKLLPGENVIYCGDNGNAPYGNRTGAEIVELTSHMLRYLANRGVKMVAVACNTISTTFDLPEFGGYQDQFGVPVLSIVRAAAEDVGHLRYQSVGVIATAFTIASRCYPTLIDELDPDIAVFGEPSVNLAALIEQGDLTSAAIDTEVTNHLNDLLDAHSVRDIVLGCTHYPILQPLFEAKAPHVAFINPAKDQARDVRLQLVKSGLLLHGSHDTVGTLEINTSGTRPVFDTVLNELGITRDYTLTEHVDYASVSAS